MKSYYFNAVVETDGSIHLSGLPPQTEVEIIVRERTGLSEEMQNWMNDIRKRHPFAKMSKEEVLEALRQTREEVWVDMKNDNDNSDELRPEYQREDFGEMVRGKYAKQMTEKEQRFSTTEVTEKGDSSLRSE